MAKKDLIDIKDASETLCCHPDTLRRWECTGKLVPAFRTPGGHRRYWRKDVEALLGVVTNLPEITQLEKAISDANTRLEQLKGK